MKVGLKFPVFLCFMFFALSCADKQHVQVHSFPGATWHRFDILSFDLPVNKAADEYSVQAIIRYTEAFEHDRIPVHFIMTYPSGEERIWEQTLTIRDREGNFQGTKADGVYEVVIPLRTRLSFREPGNCNITAEQIIPKYNSSGIVSFGLRLIRN